MDWNGYPPVPLPKGMLPPRLEDDSWLDEEIEEEADENMKNRLKEIKRSMRKINNEAKRKYISDERKRIVEWKDYVKDFESTEGFEVGVYPDLACKICGPFITRYYYPPDTTVTDCEFDKLTYFAILAMEGKVYNNVRVIKAMRSFSYGLWYYLTFEAVLSDNSTQIFEAKLYEEPPLKDPNVKVEFVRPKKTSPN